MILFCVAALWVVMPLISGCSSATEKSVEHYPQVDIKRNITIPTVDISGVTIPSDLERHVVIASGDGEDDWQHPHILLMPDGKTMFAVWTYDHGRPCGPIKRSDDGGLTWSDFLDVPDNWSTVRDCPTIHRLIDPDGVERLFLFAGVNTLYQSI